MPFLYSVVLFARPVAIIIFCIFTVYSSKRYLLSVLAPGGVLYGAFSRCQLLLCIGRFCSLPRAVNQDNSKLVFQVELFPFI